MDSKDPATGEQAVVTVDVGRPVAGPAPAVTAEDRAVTDPPVRVAVVTA